MISMVSRALPVLHLFIDLYGFLISNSKALRPILFLLLNLKIKFQKYSRFYFCVCYTRFSFLGPVSSSDNSWIYFPEKQPHLFRGTILIWIPRVPLALLVNVRHIIIPVILYHFHYPGE